jgi:hypothetical protein
MAPLIVHVPRGTTQAAVLHLSAPADASLGVTMLHIEESAFNGAQQDFVAGGPSVTVTPSDVAVSLAPPDGLTMRVGGTTSVTVTVDLGSGANTVVVDLAVDTTALPPGIAVSPTQFGFTNNAEYMSTLNPTTFDPNGVATLTITLSADAASARAGEFPLQLNWSAYAGQQRGTITENVTVTLEQMIWHSGPMNAGDVSGWADLGMVSNGDWSFRGHLHDNGMIVGDTFGFAVAFRFLVGNNVGTIVQTGDLGAVFGGSRDADWQQPGSSTWIAQNWDAIIAQGVVWDLEVKSDPGQVIQEIVAAVEIAAVVVAVGFMLLSGGKANGKIRWENGTFIYEY